MSEQDSTIPALIKTAKQHNENMAFPGTPGLIENVLLNVNFTKDQQLRKDCAKLTGISL